MRDHYVLLILLFSMLFTGTAFGAGKVGAVVFVKGHAMARDAAGEHPLSMSSPVHEGDTLITTGGARLAVKMIDDSLLTFGGQTQIRVQRFRYRASSKTGEATMRLLKGVFRAVTGMLGKGSDPRFTVIAPNATLGIRGTDFWVGYGYFTRGMLEVALIGGKGVYLKNQAGLTELSTPGTGSGTSARTEPPSPAVRWPDEKMNRALASVAWK